LSDEAAVRAFVALELAGELRARLRAALEKVRMSVPGVRLLSTDGLHLTLRFLGPARLAQLEQMKTALAAEAAARPPFAACVGGRGMCPARGAPRVLWLALETTPDLAPLQAACEGAARAAGFEPERRPFRSHLTVGRFRERVARPQLPPLDLGETILSSLVLFRSELRPEGARHTPLATFTLAGAP
jgi:2'-5' RNA ligase